jgi:hypothetical protein
MKTVSLLLCALVALGAALYAHTPGVRITNARTAVTQSQAGREQTAVPVDQATPPIAALPRVEKEHLVYEGSFRFPHMDSADRYAHGGTALAFNPDGGTFYMAGNGQRQTVVEFAMPALRKPGEELLNVTMVQKFADVTDGKWNRIDRSRVYAKVGGILPWEDKLIVAMYQYYDARGSQKRSHFVSGRDLGVVDDAQGPFAVGKLKTGYVSGYMTRVPKAWQAALGGPALTGNCCLSIISRTSYGPAISSFDPNDIGAKDPAPATPLLYYPADRPLAPFTGKANTLYNATTKITGVVFPEGTRSVLFFGQHGLGVACYSNPTNPNCTLSDGTFAAGYLAPPMVSQVWAYDANDLADVKAGKRKPWEVKPYATWAFEFPIEPRRKAVGGAAYDPATGRIFLSHAKGEHPLVHVYRVTVK